MIRIRFDLGVCIQKFEETGLLSEVKGIQLLDADGHFIMGRGCGENGCPIIETREYMVRAVRLYPYNSNVLFRNRSSHSSLAEPDNEEMKMGIYVFGDEFTGHLSQFSIPWTD